MKNEDKASLPAEMNSMKNFDPGRGIACHIS